MSNYFQIFTDPAYLNGSCYIEFLPGFYREKHRNVGSLFLDLDVFDFALLHIGTYVEAELELRYENTAVEWQEWERIVKDMLAAKDALHSARTIDEAIEAAKFKNFEWAQEILREDFVRNKTAIADFYNSLGTWLRKTARANGVITILGI